MKPSSPWAPERYQALMDELKRNIPEGEALKKALGRALILSCKQTPCSSADFKEGIEERER